MTAAEDMCMPMLLLHGNLSCESTVERHVKEETSIAAQNKDGGVFELVFDFVKNT